MLSKQRRSNENAYFTDIKDYIVTYFQDEQNCQLLLLQNLVEPQKHLVITLKENRKFQHLDHIDEFKDDEQIINKNHKNLEFVKKNTFDLNEK